MFDDSESEQRSQKWIRIFLKSFLNKAGALIISAKVEFVFIAYNFYRSNQKLSKFYLNYFKITY